MLLNMEATIVPKYFNSKVKYIAFWNCLLLNMINIIQKALSWLVYMLNVEMDCCYCCFCYCVILCYIVIVIFEVVFCHITYAIN